MSKTNNSSKRFAILPFGGAKSTATAIASHMNGVAVAVDGPEGKWAVLAENVHIVITSNKLKKDAHRAICAAKDGSRKTAYELACLQEE